MLWTKELFNLSTLKNAIKESAVRNVVKEFKEYFTGWWKSVLLEKLLWGKVNCKPWVGCQGSLKYIRTLFHFFLNSGRLHINCSNLLCSRNRKFCKLKRWWCYVPSRKIYLCNWIFVFLQFDAIKMIKHLNKDQPYKIVYSFVYLWKWYIDINVPIEENKDI